MTDLILPRRTDGEQPDVIRNARQITLIGANGAGKTRFMYEMMDSLGERAYHLSALSAAFPERTPSTRPGSVDMLYAGMAKARPYMRNDAVSELDKLAFMLVTDEFDHLLDLKARTLAGEELPPARPTRLDRVMQVWERIFPGSEILRHAGRLMFANTSGDDPVNPVALSQGEKTVFYYLAAVLYAMPGAVVFIDSPTLFLHPAILNTLWNTVEALRPDCTFVYNTVDPDFVNSRTQNKCVWIRSYDAAEHSWEYRVLDYSGITDDLFVDIIGSRRPVLFVEGDREHSIDSKLYTLVFSDYTVRPLGSCDKVIESTRTFNDLKRMHHLDSRGIVDRDRRTQPEVDYLRRKNIFVPNVAEVENIFLLEDVIRVMAQARGRNADRVVQKVKDDVIHTFSKLYEKQVLEHVRHQIKRSVECKIDGRFTCITALETHLRQLVDKLRPRDVYNRTRAEFQGYIDTRDYAGILRVFNHKPMLAESPVARLLGFNSKDEYISGVLATLKGYGREAANLRAAIKHCFGLNSEGETADTAAETRTVAEAAAAASVPFHYTPAAQHTKSKRARRRASDEAADVPGAARRKKNKKKKKAARRRRRERDEG